MGAVTRQDVRDFLADLIARGAAQDAADAIGWVVVTLDPEAGAVHLTGPFDHPPAALEWAEAHERDLNRGLGADEDPYVVIVRPMHSPG